MSKQTLEQRYADLLGKPEDAQLVELIEKLDTAYQIPVPVPNPRQFSAPTQRPLLLKTASPVEIRRWTQPRRKAPARLLLAAAAVLVTLLLAAASLPLWLQAITGAAQGQADLPLSAYQTLHQSRTLPGIGITLTLEKGYADANRVLLIYTYILPQKYGNDPLSVFATTTADSHGVLPDITNGKSWNSASDASVNSKNAGALSYDTSSIADDPGTLRLHLTVTRVLVEAPGSAEGGSVQDPAFSGHLTFDFSLPFHPGKLLQPRQTITAGGQAITLERVMITRSETTMYFSGIQSLDNLMHKLTVSGRPYSDADDSTGFRGTNCHIKIDPTGCQVAVEIPHDYFDTTGSWSITLTNGLSWTFHFNVP